MFFMLMMFILKLEVLFFSCHRYEHHLFLSSEKSECRERFIRDSNCKCKTVMHIDLFIYITSHYGIKMVFDAGFVCVM